MLHYYIEPKILTNLLTEYEVEYIKKSCLNNFHRSRTSGGKIDEIRMSESATLKKDDPIFTYKRGNKWYSLKSNDVNKYLKRFEIP